jgi:hypothetical protein
MDVRLLRQHLESSARADAPGADLIEHMLQLALAGRWDLLAKWPDVDRWRAQYQQDQDGFKAKWQRVIDDLYAALPRNSLHRLGSLSRFNVEGESDLSPAEQLQRIADRENALLKTAFAFKLVDLIEPAAVRASKLAELVVNEPASEEADRYLEEASQCFFFGVFTACVVMCRSLLEEVLESRLPADLVQRLNARNAEREVTLGSLLFVVNNAPSSPYFSAKFLRAARIVNQLGTRGAHGHPATEQDAWECLSKTREALKHLLGPH